MDAEWAPHITAFLDELRHTRRLSALTIQAYGRELKALAERSLTPPAALDSATLRRLLAKAHAEGLSGRSLARRLSAWRSFFSWWGTHHGGVNPAKGLKAPKSERKLPSALSVDAAMRLMTPPANGKTALAEEAMFELLYSSGLRLSELIRLDLEDLDLAQGLVTVAGKGGKRRTVPVGKVALAALTAWLSVRPSKLKDPNAQALFIGPRGTRYSARTLQDRLKQRAKALGLPEHVHPHMLRHSCASHVLQSSSDLRAVQELLGHASIASTQIYTHLDFQSLAKAYDAAHPRARKISEGENT